MGRGYYLNSLREWKRDFERGQRKDSKRLETLKGMGHPGAADQEALLKIRDGWIKQIEIEIATVLNGERY